MSRLAPVIPLQIARKLKESGHLGGYHLLLAHDVLRHSDEYRDVYSGLKDRLVILDNSLIELGRPMTAEEMLPAVRAVNADYVVLPDVLGDSEATIELSKAFIRTITHLPASVVGFAEWAGVVQGSSLIECVSCAGDLANLGVEMLCIPRHLTGKLGSRTEVTFAVAQRWPKPIHLLGFSNNLLDDVVSARIPGVIGIDSAVPVRAALAEETMDLHLPHFDPGPRGNYWDVAEERLNRHTMANIMIELEQYRRWIDVPYCR